MTKSVKEFVIRNGWDTLNLQGKQHDLKENLVWIDRMQYVVEGKY